MTAPTINPRIATRVRETKETSIRIVVNLDDSSFREFRTGIPFFDHMLDAMSLHGGIGLAVEATGDLAVDPHHLVEDVGIVLGCAIRDALRDAGPIERCGFFVFPMDGSQAQVAIDLCGRATLIWNVHLSGRNVGSFDPGLIREFFKAFADSARWAIHVTVPYADNDHHVIEAVFKAFGRALRGAIRRTTATGMSTKGVIDD